MMAMTWSFVAMPEALVSADGGDGNGGRGGSSCIRCSGKSMKQKSDKDTAAAANAVMKLAPRIDPQNSGRPADGS